MKNARTRLLVSLNYGATVLLPFALVIAAWVAKPRQAALLSLVFALTWWGYLQNNPVAYRTGAPDKAYSQGSWMFSTMRRFLQLQLHRTAAVEEQLMAGPKREDGSPCTGQAIFAGFPHGVNGDFRVLIDGMLYDAFPKVWLKAQCRALAASILFQLPFIRSISLRTSCVDASRATAQRCLKAGHSVFVMPGGEIEQLETICGRERVFLNSRLGFVKLALQHGVPLVPMYVFGNSDLYSTYRFAHGLRLWISKALHIALPIYSGDLGLYMYPTPFGFPRPVAQNVVFGDPVRFEHTAEPSRVQVAAAHAVFVAALTRLFDEHKAAYGCAGRTLEVL